MNIRISLINLIICHIGFGIAIFFINFDTAILGVTSGFYNIILIFLLIVSFIGIISNGIVFVAKMKEKFRE